MSAQVAALSLWQPWATLVAIGAKRIETRHWAPGHDLVGQRLAIHATLRRQDLELADVEPFRSALGGRELVLGALVGHVRVDRVEPMTPELIAALRSADPREIAFGHYAVGRYAWRLSDARLLPRPVQWRGHQSLFSVPASMVGITTVSPAQGSLL